MGPTNENSLVFLDNFEFSSINGITEVKVLDDILTKITFHKDNLKAISKDVQQIEYLSFRAENIIKRINEKKKTILLEKQISSSLSLEANVIHDVFLKKDTFGETDIQQILNDLNRVKNVIQQCNENIDFKVIDDEITEKLNIIKKIQKNPAEASATDLDDLVDNLRNLKDLVFNSGNEAVENNKSKSVNVEMAGMQFPITMEDWKKSHLDAFIKKLDNRINRIENSYSVKEPDDEIRNQIVNCPLFNGIIDEEDLFKDKAEILQGLFLGRADAEGTYDLVVLAANPNNLDKCVKYLQLFTFSQGEVSINELRQNSQASLQEALKRIHLAQKSGQKVLVCCQQGKDRSALVVTAYLMSKYGVTAEQAANFLKTKRPIVTVDTVSEVKGKDAPYWDFLKQEFNPNFSLTD